MTWTVRQLGQCRICGSPDPKRFLHLPRMPLTDEFLTLDQRGTEFVADLDIYFCPACRTVQTLHDVDVGDYYRDYGYTVSASPLARRFMQELAQRSFARFNLRPGDAVLEIGSGDGEQLACFRDRGARVLGFEPSAELVRQSRARGIEVVPGLFTADSIAAIPADIRPAQVVLLTYTFDHLPDPRGFLESIRSLLDPQRGVLLIEVHDVGKIVARHETCLFAHEHSIYLHAASMERLLARAGFEMLTTDLVPDPLRRANSLLVAAAPGTKAASASDATSAAATDGRPAPLDAWRTYDEFGASVEQAHTRLRDYVKDQRAAGRRLAGYGAGGRGIMTLAMAGLTAADLDYLCDRNPAIHGRLTPVSHVPVVAPDRLLADPADEVIVFSYGYLEEIRAALPRYEAAGGRFVSLLDLLR